MQSKYLFSSLLLASLPLLSWACGDEFSAATEAANSVQSSSGVAGGSTTDNDGDGFTADVDCDDDDDSVYPGAPELCDDKLNDCIKLNKDVGAATLFPSAGGEPKDLSETLRAGSADKPVSFSVDEPGIIRLCRRVEGQPWYVSFVVNSDATVEGVGQDVALSGAGKVPLFEVGASGVTATLRKVRVQDGVATKTWMDPKNGTQQVGAGVHCAFSSELIVADVTFEANLGDRGVGFLASSCKGSFSNVTFTKNLLQHEVVALHAGAELVHDGGRYIENSGGAVGVYGDSKFTFVGRSNQPEFQSNGVDGGTVGGILLTAGEVTVSGTTFNKNIAKRGGAIAVTGEGTATLTLSKSSFDENQAVSMSEPSGVSGGGIYLAGTTSLTATEEVKFSASVPADEDVVFDGCSSCNPDQDGIARYSTTTLTEQFSCEASAGCVATP